jgi:hypothetical protein
MVGADPTHQATPGCERHANTIRAMEAIYDRSGHVVAWMDDGGDIQDQATNRWVATVNDDVVHTWTGRYIGRFRSGNFYDASGTVVAFTGDATGGPMKPIRTISPVRSISSIKPIKSIRSISSIASIPSSSWSRLTWSGYVA